ncbi:MAG: YdeI/OmpD-associated family protein [Solirubrobacterales bacterium]|nr:YdeI/OmpD-associated family protein [Solirubrobacterales bacterium]
MPMTTKKQSLPILEFADRGAWERWLEENHESSGAVWVKIAKKGAPRGTVTYPEAVEEAIRYGWIDGQKAAHDDSFWLQRFTRRGSRSKWSQINRDKANELIAQNRMTAAGLAQVRAAKEDGRWDQAYESQRQATVPEDLQRALDENPAAKEFFATLRGANRYAFLYRLHQTKTPAARARRIATYIDMLTEHRTFYP